MIFSGDIKSTFGFIAKDTCRHNEGIVGDLWPVRLRIESLFLNDRTIFIESSTTILDLDVSYCSNPGLKLSEAVVIVTISRLDPFFCLVQQKQAIYKLLDFLYFA